MTDWKPCFMTTGLGSMPFTEPEEAVDLVFSTTPDLPYWPQLPARSNWEHIVMQFTNGLPVTTSADDTVEVKAPSDNDRAAMLTQFYENDLSDNIEAFALTKTTAAGFFAFLDRFYKLSELPDRLKGQLFGPLTFLQAARDAQGRMILYDTELAQACALGLGFAGAWQVENLPKTKEWPLIMIDDPGFYLVGTSNLGMSGSEAVNLLNTTIDPVAKRGAVVGVHSCAQADWSLFFSSNIDMLSFDAYSFGQSLALYPDQTAQFIDKGGIIAWGMVPTNNFTGNETADGLLRKLESYLDDLESKGISRQKLEEQALLTPSCGLGSLSIKNSKRILDLLMEMKKLIDG